MCETCAPYFPSSIRSWNSLDQSVKDASSNHEFKRKLTLKNLKIFVMTLALDVWTQFLLAWGCIVLSWTATSLEIILLYIYRLWQTVVNVCERLWNYQEKYQKSHQQHKNLFRKFVYEMMEAIITLMQKKTQKRTIFEDMHYLTNPPNSSNSIEDRT